MKRLDLLNRSAQAPVGGRSRLLQAAAAVLVMLAATVMVHMFSSRAGDLLAVMAPTSARESTGALGPAKLLDSGRPCDMAWSPDGKTLITAEGTTLSFWDGRSGRFEKTLDTGLEKPIDVVAWSPSGSFIVACAQDGAVKRIACATAMTEELVKSGSPYFDYRPVWAPNGLTLALNTSSGVLFSPEKGPVRKVIGGAVSSLSWSPDSNMLAVADESGVFMVSPGGERKKILDGPAWRALWSPDGRFIYLSTAKSTSSAAEESPQGGPTSLPMACVCRT